MDGGAGPELVARAKEWRSVALAAVCDLVEPWAHGTIVRATRHPSYFDFNLVRVEDDPRTGVGELAGFADEALAGLSHRRIDFDLIEAAEPLRAGFEALGWKSSRLMWMRHEGAPPPGPDVAVEEAARLPSRVDGHGDHPLARSASRSGMTRSCASSWTK